MKNYIKIISVIILIVIQGCSAEKVVDQVFNDTSSGATLRTLSASLDLDLADLNSSISITLEEQDPTQGNIFQDMQIFLSFLDNTDDGVDNSKPEQALITVPASSFTSNARGLPEYVYTTTLSELTSALSVASGQFTGGDQFNIRFNVRLTDGREFSAAQGNSNITGGSYFSSPYEYRATVGCPFDETLFTGAYTMTQLNNGAFGNIFDASGILTVMLEQTSGTRRSFSAVYLPQFGIGNDAREFEFTLLCGKVIFGDGQSSGLQCSNGIIFGPAEIPGIFSFGSTVDDSEFTLTLRDDINNDCGNGSPDVTFRMTKN